MTQSHATGSTVVYLNGRFGPLSEAMLPVEDRGCLFGDGVYEVLRCFDGHLLAMQAHMDRLHRSLAGIELTPPATVAELPMISQQVLERNGWTNAQLYWQITRGSGPRSHVIDPSFTPTLLVMGYPLPPLAPRLPDAVAAVTAPDPRWARCWIKSLMLLPNSLARTHAAAAGAGETIFHRDGFVTEGSSTNVFIARDGCLITRPTDDFILHGITRQLVIDLARQQGIEVFEQPFTLADLVAADGCFITSTTRNLQPISRIDQHAIASGKPDPLTARLHDAFVDMIASQTSA